MTAFTRGRRTPTARRSGRLAALGALGLAGTLAAISGCGSALADPESESKSFDAPDERLVISSEYDLTVRTHSGGSIEVDREVPESWDPTWKLNDDTLELRGDRPRFDIGSDASGEVRVPEGLAVEVRMPNHDLEVNGLADGVTVQKTNGDVRFTAVAGTVETSMINGDISLQSTNALQTVQLRTKNGDIDANVPGEVAYDVRTDATNGDVNVDVQRRTGADRSIDVASTNGDINVRG